MSNPYRCWFTIDHATDSMRALSFSTSGRYLASASNDKTLRVYDRLRNFRMIWAYNHSSPFISLAWRTDSALVGGSMQGEVVQFTLNPFFLLGIKGPNVIYEFSSPVSSIEANQSSNQLLICSGRAVNVLSEADDHSWSLKIRLDCAHSIGEPANFKEPPVIATGAFYLKGEGECVVTYLFHGVWRVDLETGEGQWSIGPNEKIGMAAISPDRTAMVASNIRTGMDWYDLSKASWIKSSTSLERQEKDFNIPLPVKFINKGCAVVMGTTKGYAVIFHAEHGRQVQTLDHANHKIWVTALVILISFLSINASSHCLKAYQETGHQNRILATADGNVGERAKIRIWTPVNQNGVKHILRLFWFPAASQMWKYFCTALLLLLFGFALRFLPISLQEKLRDWFLIILFGDSLEEFTVISVPLPEIFETPPSSSFFVSQQFPAVLSFRVGPWTCSFNSGRFAFSVGSIIGATYYTVQAFGTHYSDNMYHIK
ncbi:WD40-repeat-containing domain protein [Lentinula lateritia]|nr:WD40-repeat-containing domain protein [Lentinula lateritia]